MRNLNTKLFCLLITFLLCGFMQYSDCHADTAKNDGFLALPVKNSYSRTVKNIVDEYNHIPYYHDFNKLNKLIKKEPENAELILIRGFMNLGIHDFLSASIDFDKVISLDKNSDLAYYGKALCCLQYLNSTELFKLHFLYTIKAEDFNVYYKPSEVDDEINKQILSSIKKENVDLYNAKKYLNKAIEINNHNANYYYFRGFINSLFLNYLRITDNNYEKFEKILATDLNLALKLNPQLLEVYGLKFYNGLLDYDNFSELKEFQDLMQLSINSNPEYVYPYIWLIYYYGELLREETDDNKIKTFESIIDKYIFIIEKKYNLTPEINYVKWSCNSIEKYDRLLLRKFIYSLPFESLTYYDLTINEDKESLAIIDKMIELSENKAYCYAKRADIKNVLKDYVGALQDYKTALEYDPNVRNKENIYVPIAELQEKLGDKYGALDTYKLLTAYNCNYIEKAKILYKKGSLEKKLGMYRNALNDYTNAIKLILKNKDSETDDNFIKLSRMLSKDIETLADIYFDRALLYDEQFKNYKMSIYDYTQALKLYPNWADAHYNRALLYEELNSRKSALEDYKKARDIYLQNNNISDYNDCIEKINELSK